MFVNVKLKWLRFLYVIDLTEPFLVNLLRMLVGRILVITTEPVKRVLPAKDTAVYVPLGSRATNANLVRNIYMYTFFFTIYSFTLRMTSKYV